MACAMARWTVTSACRLCGGGGGIWKLGRIAELEEAWSHGKKAAEVEDPVSGVRTRGPHGTNMTASPVTNGGRLSRTQKRKHRPEALSYFVMSFPLHKKGRRIGQGDAL